VVQIAFSRLRARVLKSSASPARSRVIDSSLSSERFDASAYPSALSTVTVTRSNVFFSALRTHASPRASLYSPSEARSAPQDRAEFEDSACELACEGAARGTANLENVNDSLIRFFPVSGKRSPNTRRERSLISSSETRQRKAPLNNNEASSNVSRDNVASDFS